MFSAIWANKKGAFKEAPIVSAAAAAVVVAATAAVVAAAVVAAAAAAEEDNDKDDYPERTVVTTVAEHKISLSSRCKIPCPLLSAISRGTLPFCVG